MTYDIIGNIAILKEADKKLAKKILKLLEKDEDMIEFVKDRPGHDRRYGVNWSKIKNELNWEPLHSFDEWLEKTVNWYKDNEWWWKPLKEGRPIVDRMAQKSYGSKIH